MNLCKVSLMCHVFLGGFEANLEEVYKKKMTENVTCHVYTKNIT